MKTQEMALVNSIPLLDLKRQDFLLQEEMESALKAVIQTGMYILGPEIMRLEQTLAEYSQCKHAIACASGSEALLMSLMALDIQPGDEVIVPSFTFFATASAVARLGAKPVFADISPQTFNISPAHVAQLITKRTRALIPVHLFGQMAEMDALLQIARDTGICVVEDAAQSIGAEYGTHRAGSMGDMGCFSFYPTKNLGAAGDGGAITTNRDDLAEKIRLIRGHGMHPRYYHKIIGLNGRLDAFQGAILNVKFPHLDDWTRTRQSNARRYAELFAEKKLNEVIQIPRCYIHGRHVWNQFCIRVPGGVRDDLRKYLSSAQIGTEIYYPLGLHEQECFAYLGYKPEDLPITHMVTRDVMALPIFPGLTEEEQKQVVEKIAEFFKCS